MLDRQITGQMSIADIMAEWENKKQKMEAALERLAVQEEERRKESLRQQQEAGETAAEEACLIPPDVQQLLDEIEGKLPVKIIVEPIERSQPGFLWEKEPAKPSKTAEEAEELGEILEFAGESCETAAELTYEVWEDQEFYEDQDSFEDSSEEYDREETEPQSMMGMRRQKENSGKTNLMTRGMSPGKLGEMTGTVMKGRKTIRIPSLW